MATPLFDADLHAFVDGQLDASEQAAIAAGLARDPARAARVARWMANRAALRAWLAPVAEEPVPLRLTLARLDPPELAPSPEKRQFLFAAGFIAGFSLGLAFAAAVLLRIV